MRTVLKDPDAVLDYAVDWSSWLVDGDIIESSTWDVPDGLVEVSDLHTDTAAVVWLSGGTAGSAYEVTNRITTASNRIDDRTLTVRVRDR